MVNSFSLSYSILWLLVIVLSMFVLQLYKYRSQIMSLNTNNTNEGLVGRDIGLSMNSIFPQLVLTDLNGKEINLNSGQRNTIMLFTKSHCKICSNVYAFLQDFKNKHPDFNLINMMISTPDEARIISEENKYQSVLIHVTTMEELPHYQVNRVPFAYVLSANGYVIDKAIINTADDLELLISSFKQKIA